MDETDSRRTLPPAPQAMTETTATTPVPPAFVIAIFAVALVVAGLIAYYGIMGHLGAGVP
jgi:hypothetical protein